MKKPLLCLPLLVSLALAGCSSSVDQPSEALPDGGRDPGASQPHNEPGKTEVDPEESANQESLEGLPEGNFSGIEAAQSSPEGAVRLYLEALAEGDVTKTCQIIDPALVNRLETVGESCASTYQGGPIPFAKDDLPKLSLQENGTSKDGRGSRVSITGPKIDKQITALEVDGTWFVDPETFRNVGD